jgi:hypothetical protein
MVGGTSEGDKPAVINDTVYAFALPNGVSSAARKK